MAQVQLQTSIHIAASAATVWDILTDFSKYDSWNPFLQSMRGDFRTGERVRVTAGGMKFSPKVLVREENQELRWLGHFLLPGIFDGEHTFLLTEHGDGTTTFEQHESFRGILVGLFAKQLKTETHAGFEAMNRALKERAERLYRRSDARLEVS